jgi:hypothetical protein
MVDPQLPGVFSFGPFPQMCNNKLDKKIMSTRNWEQGVEGSTHK